MPLSSRRPSRSSGRASDVLTLSREGTAPNMPDPPRASSPRGMQRLRRASGGRNAIAALRRDDGTTPRTGDPGDEDARRRMRRAERAHHMDVLGQLTIAFDE